MLVQRVLNPEKKNRIVGSTFHLIFLDAINAVLYDRLLDSPIIYGNKTLCKDAVINKKKLSSLIEPNASITLYVYRIEEGHVQKVGNPLRGKPETLTIPNF